MEKNEKNYIKWTAIGSAILLFVLIISLLLLGFFIGLLTLKLLGYAI